MKTDLGNMRKKPRISQKPVIKKLDQAKLQCVFWPARTCWGHSSRKLKSDITACSRWMCGVKIINHDTLPSQPKNIPRIKDVKNYLQSKMYTRNLLQRRCLFFCTMFAWVEGCKLLFLFLVNTEETQSNDFDWIRVWYLYEIGHIEK